MSFVFGLVTSSHRMLKNIQRTLGANLLGFLMLCIFKHISTGPLVVWSDWMPLSECDHHWRRLNIVECTPSSRGCLWVSIENAWMQLNMLWVCVNAFEWTLSMVQSVWVRMNTFEWVWMRLKAFNYWFWHENEYTWIPLSECESIKHIWMCLSACEHLWAVLIVLECAPSVRECLWASIGCNWMRSSACEATE